MPMPGRARDESTDNDGVHAQNVHSAQIVGAEDDPSQHLSSTLQTTATLLRMQGHLTTDPSVRRHLEKAAARVSAISEIEALIDKLALGNAVLMDRLVTQAADLGASQSDLILANATIAIRCAAFLVPLRPALLYGLTVYELARIAVDVALEQERAVEVAIDVAQNQRGDVYLTVAVRNVDGPETGLDMSETLQTFLAPLGARVRGTDMPNGVLIFSAIRHRP
jgi:two-component sensor histidine kinase